MGKRGRQNLKEIQISTHKNVFMLNNNNSNLGNFFFFFFSAARMTHGISQARGQIRAQCSCWPILQLTATLDP